MVSFLSKDMLEYFALFNRMEFAMFDNIYREATLYENLVYPRYISEIQDFSFIPNFEYEDCYIAHHLEDELWWQKDKLSEMIVADNDLVIKDASGNKVYIADVETYIPNSGGNNVYYLNQLLDDEACFIHRACGTWIGNTNRNERVTEMKESDIGGVSYRLAIKKIWGFEPDLAESSSDISDGIINGFSKKYYNVLVKKDNNDNDVYIPTVDGTPLSSTQITEIISGRDYPDNGTGNLLVSD